MGCDIHTIVEVHDGHGKWIAQKITPEIFGDRHYGLFGFLADVRNYSKVPSICERRPWPTNISVEAFEFIDYYRGCAHSCSYLSLEELLRFDYLKTFEDRRCTKEVSPGIFDGGATAAEGQGVKTLYIDFLPSSFFHDLLRLSKLGSPENVRVLFFFDN